MGVTVGETSNIRIESDEDGDSVSNNGSTMDVDGSVFHNTGIENLNDKDQLEENNNLNCLVDDWK